MLCKRYAVVDVETSPRRIIEIAVVRVEGGEITRKFRSLVCPDSPVARRILELTGIDEEDLRRAPRFADIAPHVKRHLRGCTFVAHNAPFDYRFVSREFQRMGEPFEMKRLCTVRLGRKLFPGLGRYDLDTMARQFGIRIKRRHRALDDAIAAAEILKICLRKAIPLPCAALLLQQL